MLVIKAPQYSKVVNPKSGQQEARYIFPIEFNTNDDGLSFIAEEQSNISLQTLQKLVLDNLEWWNTFLKNFLTATSKLFSKPYTVDNINKITKHTLQLNDTDNTTYPANITLYPKTIEISGGAFWINWKYETEPMIIDIPDIAGLDIHNEITHENKINNETDLEELNLDEVAIENQSTEESLEIDSPSKFYDKQRVKEARLKAKLAVYKAQRHMAMYIKKYGSEVSDSDTDYETSDDDDSGDGSEDEEVQL